MIGSHIIDCSDVLDSLSSHEDNHYHGCFCDPPYGLNFMGKAWDRGVPSVDVWREVLRVLKPGAMLLAFGGTRMWHRLAVNIEDAGFEIRDTLMWIYGSGFPKSHDISKSVSARWNGYGTALKPAWEPIILAMKPCDGTFANNALAHGVAGLNIDECRIGSVGGKGKVRQFGLQSSMGWGTRNVGHDDTIRGRWPANVMHDGSDEVVKGFPTVASSGGTYRRSSHSSAKDDGIIYGKMAGQKSGITPSIGDSGSAARYFYCAKVSRNERHLGSINCTHPTLKPIRLTTYLSALIRPPTHIDSELLIPYSGAGSEIIGALKSGWGFIYAIDNDEQSCDWAEARISAAMAVDEFNWTPIKRENIPQAPKPKALTSEDIRKIADSIPV